MAHLVLQVCQEQQEDLVMVEYQDFQEDQVFRVPQEFQALQAFQEELDNEVYLVALDFKDFLDLQEKLAFPDKQGELGPQETQDQEACQVFKVSLACQVLLAVWDFQEHRGC